MAAPWNPEYKQEYLRRLDLFMLLEDSPDLQKIAKRAYAEAPVRWINDWCITYNPRNVKPIPRSLPFILFQRQEEFVQFIMECIEEKESGLVEKSRDIGATWLCCAISVWLWLYMPGSAIGWGSRKEALVDRIGDPDSIFEKIRMIIWNLPPWMLPAKFDPRFHMSSMKILNPETGAVITGESGDQIGRGGRKMIYFKDEAAHYERPELIEAALGDNTDVQIDISSVNGPNNVFYRRRMAAEVWMPGCKIAKGKVRAFIFDWTDHPHKTQEWHDNRKARADAEGLLHLFAQEVDRDYHASLDRVIIPAHWVRSAIDAHIKLRGKEGYGEAFRMDDGMCTAALDVADEGGDKNALAGGRGRVLSIADHWGEGDTGETTRRAVSTCKEIAATELYYDSIGVGAGVKAETNRLRDAEELPASLTVHPWNAAAKVLEPEENIISGDDQSPKNEDFFANLKAQAWWKGRQAFERTHKAVTQGIVYPPEQLISLSSALPRIHELLAELSSATQKYNEKGKIVVNKKPDGGRSPNLADAVIMWNCPCREFSIFDTIGTP